MKTTATALAIAALSFAALSAHADDADPSGQFAASVKAQPTQVQAQPQQYQRGAVNPWATSYNPLHTFKGERTRAEVRNEYLNSRQAVQALTSEDSGSAYLAAHNATGNTSATSAE